MKKERDKFLTEKMGECWHEQALTRPYHDSSLIPICKCGVHGEPYSIVYWRGDTHDLFERPHNFSTWSDFGLLWEFAQKQEFWPRFLILQEDIYLAAHAHSILEWSTTELINPDRFADALYEYLKSHPIG